MPLQTVWLPESRIRCHRPKPPASGRLAKLISAGLALAGLFGTAAAAGKPNLLLITIDTLRADRLGSYGYSQARTPSLDRLAREGIRFERAFTTVPLTLPAHASILTGTYPIFHGIRDNSGFVLSPRRTTLAEVLKEEGYHTAAFVGAFVLDSKFGLDQGFEHYYDNFDLGRFENVSPGYIQRRGDEVVDQALKWLSSEPHDPFFLWLHLYDPHDPYTPPEPFASRHPGRPYDGEIEFADFQTGRLLEWLEQRKLLDHTLVALVGDHGESLGEHEEEKHGFFAYNSTLRVPLILRLPKGERAATVISETTGTVDIFPTVLQILRADRRKAPEVQGTGLLSLILGKSGSERAPLYAESYYPYLQFGWSPIRLLIARNFKYIELPQPELFDLSQDLKEEVNLFTSRQALANRMKEELDQFAVRFSAPQVADEAVQPADSETVERLNSLGYVALSAPIPRAEGNFDALPDPKEQIDLYNQIVDLFAKSAAGKHQQVIADYQAVLEKQPDLKIVRYKLGQAYFHTGRYEKAVAEFQKVVEMGGDQALATFDLAQTYLRMNRFEDAVSAFRQTLRVDPAHYRARANLGVLLKNQGKIAEAVRELEKAREAAPESVFVLNNLAVAYSLSGRLEEGLSTLRAAIAVSPEDAVLYANLGLIYRQMGRVEEARRQFETARRLNPAIFQKENAPRP